MNQIDESGQSERFLHVFDWDFAPCAGREIFQFEGTVLNTPESGHFMSQGHEQSPDFTVSPLGQDHLQMRFAAGTLLNLHGVALEALATLDYSDCRLCGLGLSECSSYGDEIYSHDFMGRIGEKAG